MENTVLKQYLCPLIPHLTKNTMEGMKKKKHKKKEVKKKSKQLLISFKIFKI